MKPLYVLVPSKRDRIFLYQVPCQFQNLSVSIFSFIRIIDDLYNRKMNDINIHYIRLYIDYDSDCGKVFCFEGIKLELVLESGGIFVHFTKGAFPGCCDTAIRDWDLSNRSKSL